MPSDPIKQQEQQINKNTLGAAQQELTSLGGRIGAIVSETEANRAIRRAKMVSDDMVEQLKASQQFQKMIADATGRISAAAQKNIQERAKLREQAAKDSAALRAEAEAETDIAGKVQVSNGLPQFKDAPTLKAPASINEDSRTRTTQTQIQSAPTQFGTLFFPMQTEQTVESSNRRDNALTAQGAEEIRRRDAELAMQARRDKLEADLGRAQLIESQRQSLAAEGMADAQFEQAQLNNRYEQLLRTGGFFEDSYRDRRNYTEDVRRSDREFGLASAQFAQRQFEFAEEFGLRERGQKFDIKQRTREFKQGQKEWRAEMELRRGLAEEDKRQFDERLATDIEQFNKGHDLALNEFAERRRNNYTNRWATVRDQDRADKALELDEQRFFLNREIGLTELGFARARDTREGVELAARLNELVQTRKTNDADRFAHNFLRATELVPGAAQSQYVDIAKAMTQHDPDLLTRALSGLQVSPDIEARMKAEIHEDNLINSRAQRELARQQHNLDVTKVWAQLTSGSIQQKTGVGAAKPPTQAQLFKMEKDLLLLDTDALDGDEKTAALYQNFTDAAIASGALPVIVTQEGFFTDSNQLQHLDLGRTYWAAQVIEQGRSLDGAKANAQEVANAVQFIENSSLFQIVEGEEDGKLVRQVVPNYSNPNRLNIDTAMKGIAGYRGMQQRREESRLDETSQFDLKIDDGGLYQLSRQAPAEDLPPPLEPLEDVLGRARQEQIQSARDALGSPEEVRLFDAEQAFVQAESELNAVAPKSTLASLAERVPMAPGAAAFTAASTLKRFSSPEARAAYSKYLSAKEEYQKAKDLVTARKKGK